MWLSSFGRWGASTYLAPLAITIGLRIQRRNGRSQGLRSAPKGRLKVDLGQGRELVEGAIPFDLLMEIFASGCGANS